MKRLITGRVSSDKGNKTIVVRVVIRQTHPVYKKQYTRHRKFMAHDENSQAKLGDLVSIRESRPISARKRFVLDRILERAQAGYEETDAAADIPMDELDKKDKPKTTPKAAAKAEKPEEAQK